MVSVESVEHEVPLGLADVKKGFDLKLKTADGEASLKFKEFVPNASYKFVKNKYFIILFFFLR